MKMQFFTILVHDDGQSADDLNQFLATHRVVSMETHFFQDSGNSGWAVCVKYVPGDGAQFPTKSGRVDYRQEFNDTDFALFAKLRDLRKTLSDREGVPLYAIFTNEHLAEMVRRRMTTIAELRNLPKVGKGRVEKYGQAFVELLAKEVPLLPKPTESKKDDKPPEKDNETFQLES